MKKLTFACLCIPIFCIMLNSCVKIGTYTEVYQCNLRIDGAEGERVMIDYVGNPVVDDFKINGNISVPYSTQMNYQHDSKKALFAAKDPLYHIKNTTTEKIYLFYILSNDEKNPVNTNIQKEKYYRQYLFELFHIYQKEDNDHNCIPNEKIQVYGDKFENYISRDKLYADLIRLNYPYMKKLEPGEEFTAQWGLEWE